MVHRPNYEDVQRYLAYVRDTMQRDEFTVKNHRITLYVLLEWADSTPLPECANKRPTFPSFVTSRPRVKNGKPLSINYMERIFKNARMFLNWARKEYPSRYRLSPSFVDSLRLPRAASDKREVKTVDPWTLEDVLKIAALELEEWRLKRDQAAIAFLYLSGMRSGAFVTLPIECVNIKDRQIEQSPSKGVKTKNRKAAVTTLLPIPELLKVVEDWDSYIRPLFSGDMPWYVAGELERDGLSVPRYVMSSSTASKFSRRKTLVTGMHKLCDLAGIPYKIPHKVRHGHAVYGIKHAKNLEEFKAVSQNLMHSSISITDGIYGNLTGSDVRSVIANLGQSTDAQNTAADLFQNVSNMLKNPHLDGSAKKQLLMSLISELL